MINIINSQPPLETPCTRRPQKTFRGSCLERGILPSPWAMVTCTVQPKRNARAI